MLSGISIWQLLIILVIIALIFGTKKLRGIGGDLGGAIKGFKEAVKEGEKAANEKPLIDQETTSKSEQKVSDKDQA
jgi:sec-independent protein translocase protein TatA